ncbi:MAG TPA: VOC family protein [Rhizomicrobium sp.]|nr:VOC family protein [Rhizomicrobium sp.]
MPQKAVKDEERILARLHPRALRPSKFAHCVLRSANYEKSRDWYLAVLNAEIAFENEFVCFLRYDDEHHRIGIINMPDAAPLGNDRAGVEHIAFTFNTLSELLATYLRLKEKGIVPFWPIIHGPTVSLYYRDPDGVKVELQYDVFKTVEEVDAFFAAGSYAENFMGVIFDPDDMIARFEAGEPLSALTKRPPLPPGAGPWDMHRP